MSDPIAIPGVKIMLLGESGTGKTHALRTLVEAGLEVFIVFTEPGMEVLADVPSDKLHWRYIPPISAGWDSLIDSAKKINTLTFELLSKLPDINKRQYGEFLELLNTFNNFTDDRTGQSFGSVDSWDSSRVLVLDSLSGMNIMAMNLVAGSKPVKTMGDWQVSIDNIERVLVKLAVDLKCHFVLLGHLERETDEVTGGVTLVSATLGRKLGPKLPRFFSEVVHVKRVGAKFSWSTATHNVATKNRHLPLSEDLPPTFVPIIKKWRATQTEPLTK